MVLVDAVAIVLVTSVAVAAAVVLTRSEPWPLDRLLIMATAVFAATLAGRFLGRGSGDQVALAGLIFATSVAIAVGRRAINKIRSS